MLPSAALHPGRANVRLPALTQAKLGDETLDYKDLAALPKTKAIYNIDRPDLLSYSPYVSYPSEERHYAEVSALALTLTLNRLPHPTVPDANCPRTLASMSLSLSEKTKLSFS